jgi:hypothetical protein
LANFNDTLLYLRGNALIDYSQLGLLFKLYSCEVLFNRGLCYIYLQQMEAGMQDLQYAVKEKVVEDHNVIDDAIRDEAKVSAQLFIRFPFLGLALVLTLASGVHCLLDPSRRRLPPERSQSTESEAEGLPWQGPSGCGVGSQQCIHRLCRSRVE